MSSLHGMGRGRVLQRSRSVKGRGMLPWLMLSCLVGMMAPLAPAAAAVPASDCPRAGEHFSLDTPIFDILANPRAKAVVDRLAPGLLAGLPPMMQSKTLPALGAILPLRFMLRQPDLDRAGLQKELAAIPVGATDDALLCARYEQGPAPALPTVVKHPAILVFDKSTGFRDNPSVDAATASIKEMAAQEGWQLVFSHNATSFNPRDLARFDAVVWNNVSGDVLSLSQRAAFKAYIEHGGGFVGVHGSDGDFVTFWPWYVDTLIGARFVGHPSSPQQFQPGKLRVDDPASPITAGLGEGWEMTEEWYSFAGSPRKSGAHVLVTLDESSYKPVGFEGGLTMGDHPIAWTRCVGRGRSFYTAIGHLPGSYTQPSAARLLRQGITWAVKGRGESCR